MVQSQGVFDWKIVRIFTNTWLLLSIILSEFYYDNKRWIINKLTISKPKMSERTKEIFEKTNVDFSQERIINSFATIKTFTYQLLMVDIKRSAVIGGKSPNPRVIKFNDKEECNVLDFISYGKPLVLVFGSCS